MQGQRGWRELAVLGDKMNKFSGMIEGFIWSPRSGDTNNQPDSWPLEDVNLFIYLLYLASSVFCTRLSWDLLPMSFFLYRVLILISRDLPRGAQRV